jgi:outer membrane cobalamin receptor
MWEVHYTGTTRIMSFESELYVEAGGNLVGMKVLLSDSRAEVKNTTAIPYLPKVSVTATARYRFFSRLLVASNVRYTGRRFADMQNVRSLPAYVLWDARIEFGERVLVGGEVTNILDTREGRWEGYAGEPRRIMLSLGYTW